MIAAMAGLDLKEGTYPDPPGMPAKGHIGHCAPTVCREINIDNAKAITHGSVPAAHCTSQLLPSTLYG